MELIRFAKGFAWGIVATVLMSVFMIVGMKTGVSPMPKLVPVAVVATWAVFLPAWQAMVLGFGAHFLYGGFWAGLTTLMARRVTVWHGLALGIGLWVFMGWIFLPFIGWGNFGSAVDPRIAWATLILHLVYGVTFGALADRGAARSGAHGSAHPAEAAS